MFLLVLKALGERNYHIFYCMLAGITAEEKKALALSDPGEYKFLTKVTAVTFSSFTRSRIYQGNLLQGSCIRCEGRDDAGMYRHIRSAMELFFSEGQHQDILKLLAAILHLGNISFEGERSHAHPGILYVGGNGDFSGCPLRNQETLRKTWKPAASANPNTSASRPPCWG